MGSRRGNDAPLTARQFFHITPLGRAISEKMANSCIFLMTREACGMKVAWFCPEPTKAEGKPAISLG